MSPPIETLLEPQKAKLIAPQNYQVILETTQGQVKILVDRASAPLGADRFFNLVNLGFYEDTAFFRVVAGFVAQAGIHSDPRVSRAWRNALIKDDPVRAKNAAGAICFATSGRDARSTQFFVNLKDNTRLDALGFAAFGRVEEMSVVQKLYSGYGEGPPGGVGPKQGQIQREGRAYLLREFPALDHILSARIAGC